MCLIAVVIFTGLASAIAQKQKNRLRGPVFIACSLKLFFCKLLIKSHNGFDALVEISQRIVLIG